MKISRLFILFMSIMTLSSCSNNKEEYEKSLAEQGEITSRQQVEAERAELARKAAEMEMYLDERKMFIESIQGEFLGDLVVDGSEFQVSLEIISSLPIEYHDRTRQLEEIAYEIENLSLNLKIKMENPRVPNSASSCNIVNYKPNIKEGIINIISNECKNIFKFILSDSLETLQINDGYKEAIIISKKILNDEIDTIEYFDGLFESSISSQKYQFKLERMR